MPCTATQQPHYKAGFFILVVIRGQPALQDRVIGGRRKNMSLLDFLTGTKRPAKGTPVLPAQEVRDRLLSLNRPTAPYRLIDGISENVDLIAEWKIVEAQ